MKYDNIGRWINGTELEFFKSLSFNERIKWAREEFNKIYIGEYSVRKVAAKSGVISNMGLHYLEKNEGGLPRQTTLNALAEYYQIPISTFSAHEPESFFLGKHYDDDQDNNLKADIRSPYHEVEINFILRDSQGNPTIKDTILLKTRLIDGEEWYLRIKQESEIIQKRLDKQSRMDEAYDILKRKPAKND